MSKLTSAAAPSAESTLSQSSSTCLSQISTQYLIKTSIEEEFAAGVRVVQSIFHDSINMEIKAAACVLPVSLWH